MSDEQRKLDVDLIQRGRYQPRTDMSREQLLELADSIRAQGVIQSIVVRPIGGGRYEILCGERRWRAAQLAGLHEVPVVIRPCSDREAIFISLTENIQREGLNPVDEANAIQRIIDEFGGTHDEISKYVGYSRSVVTNKLRLLKLGRIAKELLQSGQLTEAQARPMIGLPDMDQTILAREAVAKGLDSKTIEKRAMRLKGRPDHGPGAAKGASWRSIERELSQHYGNKTEIAEVKKGAFQIRIDAHSLDELDGILEKMLQRRITPDESDD